MKQCVLRFAALIPLAALFSFSPTLYAGWFDSDDTIHVELSKPLQKNANTEKYTAAIHIAGYVDARNGMAPQKIGISTQRVIGISGKELVLDRAVSDLVAAAIKKRFDDAGFQVLEGASGNALYELSGVVRELTYNVKEQDEISISLETTLKEVATGKVVWSGAVVEKPKGRFAGISGNGKGDIAHYMMQELGVVTQKTYDAISAILMATRPDLFNLTPGTKPIAGVTVLQAASGTPAAATASAAQSGMLILNTKPIRAKVYLDGIYYGLTPIRAEVAVGVREVNIKLDGYKSVTEKVSVRKGDTTELELSLEQ